MLTSDNERSRKTEKSEEQKKIDSLNENISLLSTKISRRSAISAGAGVAAAAVAGLAVGGAIGYLAHPTSTASGTTTTITVPGSGVTTTVTETCTGSEVSSTVGTPEGTFVAVAGGTGIGFFDPINASVAPTAAMFDVNFKLTGPSANCTTAFVNAFTAAVDENPDGIGVTYCKAVCTAINSAVSGGLPVMTWLVDDAECISDPHPSHRLAYVGTSQYALSYDVGTTIVPAIQKLNPPKNLSVPVFIQRPGAADLEARRSGYQAGLAATFPCFTYTEILSGPCNTDQSTSQATAYLTAHPDALVALATDGISTPGIAGAIENLNLKGKIVAAGYDLLLENLQAIQAGGLYAIANQQPYIQLPTLVYTLLMYKKSSHLIDPWNSLTGASVVTACNVSFYYDNRASPYVGATSLTPFCVQTCSSTTSS